MYTRLRERLEDGRQAGFTLIELLIVIVILGILAAIVVFAVGSARDDSRLNACKADKKTVATALEAHKAKTGSYPAAQSSTSNTALVPSYLREWPSSTEYTIATTAAGAVTVSSGPAGC